MSHFIGRFRKHGNPYNALLQIQLKDQEQKQVKAKIKPKKLDMYNLLLPRSFDVVTVVPPGAKGSFFFDNSV